MRTNIEIDDKLLQKAIALTGQPTKRAVVEEALRLAVQLDNQARGLRQLWGIGWEGNLDEMRASRFPDWDTREDEVNKSESSMRRRSVA
jgi:Arc/MetJ family transcription regulator